MNWLTQSFDQHTVAWILISTLLGGVSGGFVTFLFDGILAPRLQLRRETVRIVRQHTAPLVRSAEALERRINILVRNEHSRWFEEDSYFHLSTLYVFGEYLGWVRVLERKFGFLPYESIKRGREFNKRVNGLFRALASHAYFRWHADVNAVDRSQVPRLMLTAIGEAMTREGDTPNVLEFTDFVLVYDRDPQFRRWFAELELLLRETHLIDALRWDRIIAAGANLRALICFLDPKSEMTQQRTIVNLDRLAHQEVRGLIESEFPRLLPSRR